MSPVQVIVPSLTVVGCGQNGVNTNGAAAKLINIDRLGEKVRPGTTGNIKVGYREYPKSASVKKHENCSDPIGADPICPFPKSGYG